MPNNILTQHKPNFVRTYFVFTKIIENQWFAAEGANSIIFINKGAGAVEISGVQLAFNQSLSLSGNSLDQDYTSYQVSFIGAGARDLNVIQKFNTFE